MAVLRFLWAVLTSRWLWSLIGIALLGAIVWLFGPLVGIGTARPLAGEIARLGVILAIVLIWLVWIILAQRRAIRANRLFVSELVVPEVKPHDPSAEGVAAVGAKFQEIMAELKRRKLGGRRFLRDMPWYVIIGPPASGKTTALRQSGLEFPFDLTDDLQGVGGTRNCDWFFTETAVLIDTAGRYVQQESQPEVDAAEWLGFLDLLKKHRGRKALNGVIVAISAEILAEGDASIRAHGREIRKRLTELNTRLEIRLPVYLARHQVRPRQGLRVRPSRASPPPTASRSGARPSPPARRPTAARSAASSQHSSSASRAASARAWRARRRWPRGPKSSASRPRSRASRRRSGSSSTASSARAATRRAPGCAAST